MFSLDPGTGAFTQLHSFTASGDGQYPEQTDLIAVNGTLFGTTVGGGAYNNCNLRGAGCGTVFSLDLGTGAETVLYSFCQQDNCADGANPLAGLTDVRGMLYGTTFEGDVAYGGAVFALKPKR